MKFLRQLILCLIVVGGLPGVILAASDMEVGGEKRQSLAVYIFWQEGCPHCAKARAELKTLVDGKPQIEVRSIRLGRNSATDALFAKTLRFFSHL